MSCSTRSTQGRIAVYIESKKWSGVWVCIKQKMATVPAWDCERSLQAGSWGRGARQDSVPGTSGQARKLNHDGDGMIDWMRQNCLTVLTDADLS